MVYRLHRASKFLRIRLFVVLIVYALIVGLIGAFLLNFVVMFDTQSFTPQVIDENAKTLDTLKGNADPDSGLLCENYKSEGCNWYLYKDFSNRSEIQFLRESHPEIFNLEFKFANGELLVVREKPTDLLKLATVKLETNSLYLFNKTYDASIYAGFEGGHPVVMDDNPCFSLAQGQLCVETGNLVYEPNLKFFDFSFLGSQILINNTDNSILCNNFQMNCPYYPADIKSQIYTYFNVNTEKLVNISARQSIIKPFREVSGPTLPGDIDQGFFEEICVVNTGSCNGIVNYNDTQKDTYFVFRDSITKSLWVSQLSLYSIPSTEALEFSKDLQLTNPVEYACTFSQTADENTKLKISLENTASIDLGQRAAVNLQCSSSFESVTAGTTGVSGRSYSLVDEPIANHEFPAKNNNPKLAFQYNFKQEKLFFTFITLPVTTENRSSPAIIMDILSKPKVFLNSMVNNDVSVSLLPVVILFFGVNLVVAFLLIIFRFWRYVGRFFGLRVPILLRGKFGKILQFTQFFEFSGQWYLEIHGVYDYNFKSTRGVVHELVNERWRDTIFFPTALAASISIVVFSINPGPNSLPFLFVISGFMPILMAFWIPAIWIMQDSGLKRVEWSDSGELLVVERVSNNLRDGFNKLIGFGAIFGIGTAGASLARSQISGGSITSLTVFTGGIEGLLSLNWNFLISAVLWTIALLCLIASVSLIGSTMVSLSYLNSGHLTNVKRTRVKLQEHDIFLGTTQQSMDHSGKDISVYYDSDTGLKALYKKATSRSVVQQEKKFTADELTTIEVEESHQDKLFTENNNNTDSQDNSGANLDPDPESDPESDPDPNNS